LNMTDEQTGGIYLGLGSNLGDREENIQRALEGISRLPGCAVLSRSSLYRSEPWGRPDQPWFLNMVCEIRTNRDALSLLHDFKGVERAIGREPSPVRWGPRPIDIDIILYRDLNLDTAELKIPHRYCTERVFVVKPLLEIAPEIIHPVLGEPFRKFLEILIQRGEARSCLPYHPTKQRTP